MHLRNSIGIGLATIFVLGFAALGITNAVQSQAKLETTKLELQSTQDKIKLLQLKYGQLEDKLQKAEETQTTSQEQIDQLTKEKADLDKQLEQARAQVQAKAVTKQNIVAAASVSHEQLLTSAGISAGDFYYAEWLVMKESSWNPNAVNKSSGACGLAQALPCSKIGANWNDPVVALRWMDNYVKARYKSWHAAVAFHKANGWY